MGMINIKDNTTILLNDLVHDFKKTYPTTKVTQDFVIQMALKKLQGDLQ